MSVKLDNISKGSMVHDEVSYAMKPFNVLGSMEFDEWKEEGCNLIERLGARRR
jgi:hypothetical protein